MKNRASIVVFSQSMCSASLASNRSTERNDHKLSSCLFLLYGYVFLSVDVSGYTTTLPFLTVADEDISRGEVPRKTFNKNHTKKVSKV